MAASRDSSRYLSGDSSRLEITRFETILSNAARMAMTFTGCVVLVVVLVLIQEVASPVLLAIIIGFMFGPFADACEKRGIPPGLSAALVVLLLVGVITIAVLVLAVPLSQWVGKAPDIWTKLQQRLATLKDPLDSLASLQGQVTSIFGGPAAMSVRVTDNSAVTRLALIAPAIGAQALLCLASLYFFVATRHRMRVSLLSLCVSRRMRWRAAHVFGDIEEKVSRFLISVTILNFCLGVAVALAMWAVGMPSPILWGALAMILNYTPYIGQAVMVAILFSVAIGTQATWTAILAPVGSYLVLAFIEGQFVTPQVLGHRMTINPFVILLSTTFWLWAWGPVGGFVSVPSLLILQSVLEHILPGPEFVPRRRVRRLPGMTDKDVILANAAQAVRERAKQAEAEEKAAAV